VTRAFPGIAAVCLVAFAVAWWFAEDPTFPAPLMSVAIRLGSVAVPLLAAGVGLLVLLRLTMAPLAMSTNGRWLAAAAVTLSVFGGLILGTVFATRAFNECIDEAEPFRHAIVRFEAANSRYPLTLTELESQLPCTTPLRGSILHYSSHSRGFELEFHDWLVIHTGTETEPVTAFQ
jgi:hypothetical protein